MTIDGKYAVIPVASDNLVQIRVLDNTQIISFQLIIAISASLFSVIALVMMHKKRTKDSSQKKLATNENSEISQE